jgi:transcriptional regulator with XRE-family HTH domain
MFKAAREAAGLSQEQAAEILHIGRRTLSDYENGKTLVPPDVALDMSKVYGKTEIYARYCADMCPIGQVYAHKVEQKDLALAVLGLLKEYNDVGQIREGLIAIAADGEVDPEEIPEFERFMDELSHLEQKLFNLRLIAASKAWKARKENTRDSLAADSRVAIQ